MTNKTARPRTRLAPRIACTRCHGLRDATQGKYVCDPHDPHWLAWVCFACLLSACAEGGTR